MLAHRIHPVKLIIGFIFKEEKAYNKARVILEKHFGKIDFESEPSPFNRTKYYEAEFGKDLKRRFVSFARLISPTKLPSIKIIAKKIEGKLSQSKKRTVNIDPGYLDLAKLILASTKNYKHRIYLNKGVYSEITLFFENKSFRPWEWTYPDYKTGEYIAIFNRIRNIYSQQIKDRKITP